MAIPPIGHFFKPGFGAVGLFSTTNGHTKNLVSLKLKLKNIPTQQMTTSQAESFSIAGYGKTKRNKREVKGPIEETLSLSPATKKQNFTIRVP